MQFPAVVGGVVPVVNVPGVTDGEMRLNGEVLANIYLKKSLNGMTQQLKHLTQA